MQSMDLPLTLDDLRSGDIVRVMTTIAPFGGEVVL
jgi:hypothetical protein